MDFESTCQLPSSLRGKKLDFHVPCSWEACAKKLIRNHVFMSEFKFCPRCYLPYCCRQHYQRHVEEGIHQRLCRQTTPNLEERVLFALCPDYPKNSLTGGSSVGMMAKRAFRPGEVIWTEEPLIYTPLMLCARDVSPFLRDSFLQNMRFPPHEIPYAFSVSPRPERLAQHVIESLCGGRLGLLARFAQQFSIIPPMLNEVEADFSNSTYPSSSSRPNEQSLFLPSADRKQQKKHRKNKKRGKGNPNSPSTLLPPVSSTQEEIREVRGPLDTIQAPDLSQTVLMDLVAPVGSVISPHDLSASDQVIQQEIWNSYPSLAKLNPSLVAAALVHSNLLITRGIMNLDTEDPAQSDIRMCAMGHLCSFLNHSCSPSCVLIEMFGQLILLAGPQGVESEMELTIAYTSPMTLEHNLRRRILKESWRFRCVCHVCQQSASSDPSSPYCGSLKILTHSLSLIRPFHHRRLMMWLLQINTHFQGTEFNFHEVNDQLEVVLTQIIRSYVLLANPAHLLCHPSSRVEDLVQEKLQQQLEQVNVHPRSPLHRLFFLLLKVWMAWNSECLYLFRHPHFANQKPLPNVPLPGSLPVRLPISPHAPAHCHFAFRQAVDTLIKFMCFDLRASVPPDPTDQQMRGINLLRRGNQIVRKTCQLSMHDGPAKDLRLNLLHLLKAREADFDLSMRLASSQNSFEPLDPSVLLSLKAHHLEIKESLSRRVGQLYHHLQSQWPLSFFPPHVVFADQCETETRLLRDGNCGLTRKSPFLCNAIVLLHQFHLSQNQKK